MITQIPRGTKDIFGDEIIKWQYIEDKIKEICENSNIEEIRTPVFEHTELFIRGVGETTDIVNKEMYTFIDKGNRSITLRPESTAGIARAYIENSMNNMPQPIKLYYISAPTFRYERAQAGRQRQFHQFGVEMIGSFSPAQDAEVISVASRLLESVGIKDIELKINSLGCPICRNEYNKALKLFLKENINNLCNTCRDRYEKNPLRIIDCKNESCKNIIENAPNILNFLDDECNNHFQTLQKILEGMKINFVVDSKIVRGLDYYTRTVFEFVTNSIGAQGTICGGGRYDNLIEECGGQKTGAVGFGLGMERLIMTLDSQKKDFIKSEKDIYIGSIGENGFIKSQILTYELRKQGIKAECDTIGRSVKAQMKYANKIGVKYSVIIGDTELEEDKVVIKNMKNSEIKEIKLSEIISYIKY